MPDRFLSASPAGGADYAAARLAGKFVSIGISRLRLGTDGTGVTTLVCGFGCPLRCRYCLNPQSWRAGMPLAAYTPEELYRELRQDSLYFRATGGGVTFGGGEPLLQADFLPAFRAVCGPDWQINTETSLQAPRRAVAALLGTVDHWIVDLKDASPDRYRAYTGGDGNLAAENLRFLLAGAGPERVTVRLPLIPGFNTPGQREEAAESLRRMGCMHLDLFPYRTAVEK